MGSMQMMPVKLPQITLDATLTELYDEVDCRHEHKRIAQVLCCVSSAVELNDHFPRNCKYIYQDSSFNSETAENLTSHNTELRRSLSSKYLSLIPQRDAFISGATTVVLFDVDQPAQADHDHHEAMRTLEVLNPKQRPNLVFCEKPSDVGKIKDIDLIAYKLALDDLETLPLTVRSDDSWIVNSKGALARSGLPTPKARVIETPGCPPEREDCCAWCNSEETTVSVLPWCTGARGCWVEQATKRIMGEIERHPIPFVLKNQQSFGGAGTFLIQDEDAKAKVLATFDQVLWRVLSQVTAANQHLGPATIILSELIEEPVGNYGVTFFVGEEGEPVFLAASEQMTDDNCAWLGSIIDYEAQKQLKLKFRSIMFEIAEWLREHRYYGPVGADILEGKDGRLNIVDLNARTSGSMCLPLLRGHLCDSRGMGCASSFSITYKGIRDEFLGMWRDEFEAGIMCLASWYEDPDSRQSMADVVVGARDRKELRDKIERIRLTTEEIIF